MLELAFEIILGAVAVAGPVAGYFVGKRPPKVTDAQQPREAPVATLRCPGHIWREHPDEIKDGQAIFRCRRCKDEMYRKVAVDAS